MASTTIQEIYPGSSTIYAQIWDKSGNIADFNAQAFVALSTIGAGNYSHACLSLTRSTYSGGGNTPYYNAAFPGWITEGPYTVVVWIQQGGAPAMGDTQGVNPLSASQFVWTGSELLDLNDLNDAIATLSAKIGAGSQITVLYPVPDASGTFSIYRDYDYTTSSPIGPFSVPCNYNLAGATYEFWNPETQAIWSGFTIVNPVLSAGVLTFYVNATKVATEGLIPGQYNYQLRITLASSEVPSPLVAGVFEVVLP